MGAAEQHPLVAALDQMRAEMIREAEAAAERKVRELLSQVAANDSTKLLNTKQTAERLGISPVALRHLVSRRSIVPDIRGQRGGGLKGNRFSMKTIQAFIEKNRRGK